MISHNALLQENFLKLIPRHWDNANDFHSFRLLNFNCTKMDSMPLFAKLATLCFSIFSFILTPVFAAVTLPAIFGDHMVLQQNAEVTIWGWAKPLEEVSVSGNWNDQVLKIKANNQGTWQVKLQTPTAGGPYKLTVEGRNKITIEDVLIGEVWLCAGQSNMEWTPNSGIDNAEPEIAKANHPTIRFFTVNNRSAAAPQIDLEGHWEVCTPETMQQFSAVGYFFGKQMQENLNLPVGLINSSWGGTPAEAWMDANGLAQNKVLAEAATKLPDVPWGPEEPGSIYNAMIAPLMPYRVRGALWYQGEANTINGSTYDLLLTAMIQNWRQAWGYEFPFYYVQIAPYKYGRPQEGVVVRDAQRRALASIPNAGMVVVSDIGDLKDIHPKNKIDVGIRLANVALHKTYAKTELPASGPLYRDMVVEKDKIRITFDYTDSGLVIKGKELNLFEIAGEDQQFVNATAKIEGNTIVVHAKNVKNPVAVRFAWDNTAEPNLFNKEGLPASCFRTDNWVIELK